jgi:hypothetical protein
MSRRLSVTVAVSASRRRVGADAMTDQPDDGKPRPQQDKPRLLLRSSPLVAGGKARLRSPGKVTPGRAQPREITGDEVHGYTEQPHKALLDAGEALTEAEWRTHVKRRADDDEEQRQTMIARSRDRDKRLLSQEERLRKAQAEAAANRRDVTRETWLVRRMLERGRSTQAERILQRVELYAYRGRRAA